MSGNATSNGNSQDKTRAIGTTPSERYLSKLCRWAFLSLWSYTNLHTDEGRKNGKGVGHELCDLLVVFDDDVIIFSDKDAKFDRTIDISIAWKRWFKKAIRKSADQIYGAERWLRNYGDRIYLDSECTKPFPISLPPTDRIRIHRVSVARGIYKACRDYFGGNSLGSLMINSDLVGDDHYKMPFSIGHVNPDRGFVHVFEDFTLGAVLRELDTVSDFVTYLTKREKFLSNKKLAVIAPGDEQLLAIYLTKNNAEGEHDFILPGEGPADVVSLDESFWPSMIKNPQYIAKKEADKISYVWDQLIEHLIKHGIGYSPTRGTDVSLAERELALRIMASEGRVQRRHLSHALYGVIESDKGLTRLVISNTLPDVAYLFLTIPRSPDRSYDEYREMRRNVLTAYCKVAKLKAPLARFIVGFATEPDSGRGRSEDLLVLDVSNWTTEEQAEAESLQEQCSLLLDTNLSKREFSVKEYPDVPNHVESQEDNRLLNRRQRRALEARRRRSKK